MVASLPVMLPLLLPPLLQAGIPTAISSDNVRDQFYAYGDLDMLEVFTQVGGLGGNGGWTQ
jgi:cytosine deaminase